MPFLSSATALKASVVGTAVTIGAATVGQTPPVAPIAPPPDAQVVIQQQPFNQQPIVGPLTMWAAVATIVTALAPILSRALDNKIAENKRRIEESERKIADGERKNAELQAEITLTRQHSHDNWDRVNPMILGTQFNDVQVASAVNRNRENIMILVAAINEHRAIAQLAPMAGIILGEPLRPIISAAAPPSSTPAPPVTSVTLQTNSDLNPKG